MKTILLLLISIIMLCNSQLSAQSVTISPNGTSSIIEANSTSKGFLPPRMTMVQRSNLTVTDGLMVYCTDCTPAGHYGYTGGAWKPMFDYLTSTGSCATYTVGQQAQGGTVIWVDDSGQHGLVAAPVDYSRIEVSPVGTYTLDYFPWAIGINYTNTTFAMAQRIGIYGGQENTDKIIKQFGWGEYGAFLCTLRNWGGYGDWYLPSIDELIILYTNRNLLPTPLTSNGFSSTTPYADYYWSSTEGSATSAYVLLVTTVVPANVGQIGLMSKWLNGQTVSTPIQERCSIHVRAVRRF